MSLLTVSSSTTIRSRFEITKILSTSPTVCSRPDNEEAYGSFIPVRSAANCLRDFASGHTTMIPRPTSKRRRVTFKEMDSPLSSDDDNNQASLPISYINRPFPTSPKKFFQCPSMSSSSPIKATRDRNPSSGILARMERESKFCTQMVYCSTCGKSGQDYPRCGKCGVLWCSRTCRLMAGKRHVCPSVL